MILFQALFHDLTEVFALIALGVWWLARVSTDDANRFEMPGRSGKVILTGVGAVVLLFSLWLNLDVSSRVLWMKGQRIMVTDTREAVKVLARAHGLNPLLPGLGRDLAWAHLSGYRNTGTPEDLDRTGAGIRKARELNRLDTVPMRLEAALHVEQANKGPKSKARDHLFAASGILMEALKLEPYNALIMISLAGVYRDLGDHARALAMVERALETEPNYLEAHRTKIFYLSGMNPDEVNEAEKELEKAEERAAGYRPHSTYEEIILR